MWLDRTVQKITNFLYNKSRVRSRVDIGDLDESNNFDPGDRHIPKN